MAGEWRDTTLGEVIELKRGYDLPQQQRIPGRVPLVSSSGVTDHHATAMVKGPGVVTGRYGTLGQVFFVAEDFWPLNTTLYVRDFKGNDPRFISYFLRGLDFQAYSDKAAVPGLNRNHLHQARVRIPNDVNEQRAIAHILGALDDKIELNRRMNATLEEMARALFKSWFVDFDPVRAKAAGRDPGLPPDLAALFPDSFQDSELGEIPVRWGVRALPDAIWVNPPRSLQKDARAPYVEMSNLPNDSARVTHWTERPFVSGTRFVNGDVLLARITPCLENGKTAFVDFLDTGQVGWGSTEFIILHSKPPLPPEYAYFLARCDNFRDHAIQNMTGTSGRQRVPAGCLHRYPMVIPPENVARCFGEMVSPILAAIKHHDTQNATLAAIRDALLPRLLSGQLRVKDAEGIATRYA
jgi:type I restriction enzyme S subunit